MSNRKKAIILLCELPQEGDVRRHVIVADQEQAATQYCNERGYDVVAVAHVRPEVGLSGSDGFRRLREMCDDGTVSVLVAKNAALLTALGWQCIAPLADLAVSHDMSFEMVEGDTVNPKMLRVIAAFTMLELENLRERAIKGRLHAARMGRIPSGRPPYGYITDEYGKPVVNAEAAAIVCYIFRLATEEQLSSAETAEMLNEAGIQSPGGRTWRGATVHRILSNAVYMGSGVKYGGNRPGSPMDGILVPFPTIIGKLTWNETLRLRELRRRRKKVPRDLNDSAGQTSKRNRVQCDLE